MSLDYIRNYYQVPATKGKIVSYRGKLGVITGARGAHVRIRLDGEVNSLSYHPEDPDLNYDPAL